MTRKLRLVLEIGKKRRVVAGAMDWPGLAEFDGQDQVDVVERVPGSSSTDFWGIAHVPSEIEREVLSPADLERRLTLLQACWAEFDAVATTTSSELRPGARSAGRDRAQIIRHVYASEPEQFSRKIEVRTPREVVLTPDGLVAHRAAYLEALRAYNADSRAARTWPIQFLIRRTAHHVMDHTWEIEDREPSAG